MRLSLGITPVLFLLGLGLNACVQNSVSPVAQRPLHPDCVQEFDPSQDYFLDKVQVEFATGFEVDYQGHYKRVTLASPHPEANDPVEYILVQCGTPIPDDVGDAMVVEVPVQSVVVLSTTYLPHFAALDRVNHLVGISDTQITQTPAVVERVKQQKIRDVSRNQVVNIEAILNLNPDIVITFDAGGASSDTVLMLENAGLQVVLNSEYLEMSPLGRAEWLKFTALFLNQEGKAKEVFEEIRTDYQELSQRVAAAIADDTSRPTVFTGFSSTNTWYVPGRNSYAAEFLRDAGADYLWDDLDSQWTVPLDFEVVYQRARNADFWLNVNPNWQIRDDVIEDDPRYGNFAAWQGDRIYNNTKRVNEFGGNDYWETGILYPNLILADLVQIFHPNLLPDGEKTFYQNLE